MLHNVANQIAEDSENGRLIRLLSENSDFYLILPLTSPGQICSREPRLQISAFSAPASNSNAIAPELIGRQPTISSRNIFLEMTCQFKMQGV